MAALLAVFALVGGLAVRADAAPSRWVMGYYPGYDASNEPLDEIDWTAMTHIAVGAAIPKPNGGLSTKFFHGSTTEGETFARDVADAASANGVKPILMIGGGGYHDRFAAAATHRATFVHNLIKTMNRLHFVGLDLDWEPQPASELKSIKGLVNALRKAAPHALLTMPVGAVSINAGGVEPAYERIASNLDQLNVMTYEMSGPWPGWKSWFSSALHDADATTPLDVEHSVDAYEAAGIPSSKIGIGVGFYGLCWNSPVTGPRQSIGGASVISNPSYRSIMASYYSAPAAHYDATAEAPYLSPSPAINGCTYISYENPQSINAKGAWAQTEHLGGVIVWEITQAHIGGADALLQTVRSAFGA